MSSTLAEPCELQSIGWPGIPKPRIRKRFGIWSCVTMRPFVCGCGYTIGEAYAEWVRIRGGKP